MRKYYIAAGILAAAILGVYLYTKNRKKTAAPKDHAGGTVKPAVLTEEDFLLLEKEFSSGNPYNSNIVEAMEGQPESEISPTNYAGNQKTLVTKTMFNNMVLTAIRTHIGNRQGWIQEEEERRFDPSSGAARAGYNNSLGQAFAYAVRTYFATNNYYTPAAGTGTSNTGSGAASGSQYNSILEQAGYISLTNLFWQPTNVSTVIKADTIDGQILYFDLVNKVILTKAQAKMKGVQVQI